MRSQAIEDCLNRSVIEKHISRRVSTVRCRTIQQRTVTLAVVQHTNRIIPVRGKSAKNFGTILFDVMLQNSEVATSAP